MIVLMNSKERKVNKINKFCLLIIILFLSILVVKADDFQKIEYKNLKNGAKITFDGVNWNTKVNRKNNDYYLKQTSADALSLSEIYSPQGEYLFSLGTNYEFINKGSLIGYSNIDLKFYEFEVSNGQLLRRELNESEIQDLFPDFKIIKLMNFSETNSYKIKKDKKNLKIIFLNDTNNTFENYWFYTNNSKFEPYLLKGFLNIKKKGMIQFSLFGEDSKNEAWFILLVR